jgi:hypothetical protein
MFNFYINALDIEIFRAGASRKSNYIYGRFELTIILGEPP